MKNNKNWYQIKEKSAGIKRLKLSWFIYKLFGRFSLEIIAWCVSSITFLYSKSLRKYSEKYFQILYKFTLDKKHKPCLINSFKHVQSYGQALVDKMELYGNTADFDFVFENDFDEKKLYNDLETEGAFFIFTHTGNIELMRAFLKNKEHKKVNIFMQKSHCEKFNGFIDSLSDKSSDMTIYSVEDICVETALELKEKLNKGEIVFMAGDRLSAQNMNRCYNATILNQTVKLPLGTLKFALLMDSPIYFVACTKNDKKEFVITFDKFSINVEKSDNLSRLKSNFPKFLEKIVLKAPYQFYNFYDFFE